MGGASFLSTRGILFLSYQPEIGEYSHRKRLLPVGDLSVWEIGADYLSSHHFPSYRVKTDDTAHAYSDTFLHFDEMFGLIPK